MSSAPSLEQVLATIRITCMTDAAVARGLAARVARAEGFDSRRSGEIAIVVSELATNVVRHGGGRGSIELGRSAEGLVVVARDDGPGIADFELAVLDHYSQGRRLDADARSSDGLGCGLGALVRLMDGVEALNREGGGAEIRTWKRLSAVTRGRP